ncbi:MAG: family 43 glycosylhydrolase, partial [Candidatus Sumerlaeia bacterium]
MHVCNPVNLNYRFQVKDWAKVPCREAADPSMVYYEDEYWLFASKSGGYWHSTNLVDWVFVESSALPVEDYAPDVAVIDGYIYFTASRRGHLCPIYRSSNPLADAWEKVCDCPEHNDPTLFQDDDGRVYRYWGCSNHLPIYGCEMDRETMLPKGETVALYDCDPPNLGWERRGENHSDEEKAPHREGPWIVKHEGRYYLEYAVPGTQYNIYADAVVVGDKPLGPFTLQAHNPHSYKPAGFIPGAGHGSTFQDRHGNWWHTSTMRISVRHQFERRIGLWPAGFDDDGVMFCNTAFGDWPMRIPSTRWNPWKDAFAGQMLLSYGAKAEASSESPDHPAAAAFDENVQTWWASAEEEPVLGCDLGEVCTVESVQVNFAEDGAEVYGRDCEALYFRYTVEGSADGEKWQKLIDKSQSSDDLPHDFVVLDKAAEARYVRLHVLHVPDGKVAVSGFRIFGKAAGDAPKAAQDVKVVRGPEDKRNATIRWKAGDDGVGANVWWGVAPDKLYNCCMVLGSHSLDLRCLSQLQEYYFAVENFSRSG